MNDRTDSQLLRAYAEHRSEPAFAELVRRHVDFVYSAARRMVCDSHLAEDVTQAVFVALAKNPGPLTERPVLTGWLHRTAQNIAAQTVRTEVRRHAREQEAAAMNELLAHDSDATWEHIAPHLDAALGELSEADRDALLLRYFERKSAQEMAQTLGVSQEAAQKRVSRAAERLREVLCQTRHHRWRKRTCGCHLRECDSSRACRAERGDPRRCFCRNNECGRRDDGSDESHFPERSDKQLPLSRHSRSSSPCRFICNTAPANRNERNLPRNSNRCLPIPRLPRRVRQPWPLSAQSVPARLGLRSLKQSHRVNRSPRMHCSRSVRLPEPLAIQSDGKILAAATVGGWFVDESSGTLGWYTRGAMRFEANGTLDRSFYCDVGRPEATAAFMSHLCLSPDGRVFLSGLFDAVDGIPRPGYSMLLPDGRVDESFTPWRGRDECARQDISSGRHLPCDFVRRWHGGHHEREPCMAQERRTLGPLTASTPPASSSSQSTGTRRNWAFPRD